MQGDRNPGAAYAEHEREMFVGKRHPVVSHAVVSEKEPAGEALLGPVPRIAGCALGRLGREHMGELQKDPPERGALAHRPLHLGRGGAVTMAGNLHDRLMDALFGAEHDRENATAGEKDPSGPNRSVLLSRHTRRLEAIAAISAAACTLPAYGQRA